VPSRSASQASGAGRSDLVIQFIGESMIYVALSMLLALALVELLMPHSTRFSAGHPFRLLAQSPISRRASPGPCCWSGHWPAPIRPSCCPPSRRRGAPSRSGGPIGSQDCASSRHPAVSRPDWVDCVDGRSCTTKPISRRTTACGSIGPSAADRGACAKAFKMK